MKIVTCSGCGKSWGVSKLARINSKYKCPVCREKRKRHRKGAKIKYSYQVYQDSEQMSIGG